MALQVPAPHSYLRTEQMMSAYYDHDMQIQLCLVDGVADVVLSDMAPNTTGQSDVDHHRIIALCSEALDFA